ncbi:hypothetical protein VM1G_11952 [Cytospora mali]|uniref:Uncharacterized protein n=1 Tax=Cytospora mali TaxID=578113 RepID=A0A194WCZ4_CYTMA|nr:hypothetical protein VM1G_11952 [Valsa mali]
MESVYYKRSIERDADGPWYDRSSPIPSVDECGGQALGDAQDVSLQIQMLALNNHISNALLTAVTIRIPPKHLQLPL